MSNWLLDLLRGKFYRDEGEKIEKIAKKEKKFDAWLNIKEIDDEVAQWKKEMVDQVKDLDNFVLAEFLAEEDLKGKDVEDYSLLFQSYYKKVLNNREQMEKLLLSKLFDDNPNYIPQIFDENDEGVAKIKRKANIKVSRSDDVWELQIKNENDKVLVRKITDENERIDLVEKDLMNEMIETKVSDVENVVNKVAKVNGVLNETVENILRRAILEKKIGFFDENILMKVGKILKSSQDIHKWGFNISLFDVDDVMYNKVKGFECEKRGNIVDVFIPVSKKKPLNDLTLKESIKKLNSKDFSLRSNKYVDYYKRCVKADENEIYKILEELKEDGDEELYNQLMFDLSQDEIIDINERVEGEGSPMGYSSMDGSGVFIEPAKKNIYDGR